MELLLCVIGLLFVIEGIPYFGFPDKMKLLMAYLQEQDDAALRVMGAVSMAIGLAIIIIARTILGAS
ncbi:MAG: DUF2065 domain-containing protein [Deltaproteobacteria bacterium]|nr:DUF2065 domain-containing protein [Deltaproteobacteria bacterium]